MTCCSISANSRSSCVPTASPASTAPRSRSPDAGLSIDNPNSSSPKIPTGSASREGPLADQVRNLLDTRINPAIASHGGVAELVAVEGDTVYLRLGGGCQGCGMAQVTLGQGIEVAIKEAFPEILNIVDVTDHEAGANPYFE